jgi:hypothetical protein
MRPSNNAKALCRLSYNNYCLFIHIFDFNITFYGFPVFLL